MAWLKPIWAVEEARFRASPEYKYDESLLGQLLITRAERALELRSMGLSRDEITKIILRNWSISVDLYGKPKQQQDYREMLREGESFPDALGALTLEQYAQALLLEKNCGIELNGRVIRLWDHRSKRPPRRSVISYISPRFRDADEFRRGKEGRQRRSFVSAGAASAERVASYFKQDVFEAEAARWRWKQRDYMSQLRFWCFRLGATMEEREDLLAYVFEQLFSYRRNDVPGKGTVEKWCARYYDQFYTTTRGPDGKRIRKPSDAHWSHTETDRGTFADQVVHDREYGKESRPRAENAGWNPDSEDS
jgi:hypothetical protein